jgi:hypothetical protein
MQNDSTNVDDLKNIINQQEILIRELSTKLNNANIIITKADKIIITMREILAKKR